MSRIMRVNANEFLRDLRPAGFVAPRWDVNEIKNFNPLRVHICMLSEFSLWVERKTLTVNLPETVQVIKIRKQDCLNP